jgi:TonB family protein
MKFSALSLLVVLAFGASLASAQHCLMVDDNGKMLTVVAVHRKDPMVLEGGKLMTVPRAHLVLGQGGQFLPCHVAVRHVVVAASSATMLGNERGGEGEINRKLRFKCELETGFALTKVFLVLVYIPEFGEPSTLLQEVGRLEPREPRWIQAVFPVAEARTLGKYEFYLFSGGSELFHTLMPPGVADSALDHLVRERLKDVRDAPAQPFVGPAPEYPEALFKKGIEGKATVVFTIGLNGAISDPAVNEASQPEFGEAAMAVIRQWRFLPMVKDGVPVSTKATMPFVFSPPKTT